MSNILLIEVNEDDIERINIPFTLYGSIGKAKSTEMRKLFAKLNNQRKEMGETYKMMDKLFKENYEGIN